MTNMKYLKLFEQHVSPLMRVIVCAKNLESLDSLKDDFCLYDSYPDPLHKRDVKIFFSALEYSDEEAMKLNLALQMRRQMRWSDIYAEGSFYTDGKYRSVISRGGDASYFPLLNQVISEPDFFTNIEKIVHEHRGKIAARKFGM